MATIRTAQYFIDKFVSGYSVKAVDMQDFVASIPSLGATDLSAINTALALKANTTTVNTALGLKQDTLVSGTNIKSINGTPLTGSGNLTITSSGVVDNEFESFTNLAAFPATGETDLLYLDKATGKFYYWDGSVYQAQALTIGSVTGLSTALAGKEDSFTKLTAFNKNFGTTTGTVADGGVVQSNTTAIALKQNKAVTRTIPGTGVITLTFDTPFYSYVQQTGNITLALASSGNVNLVEGLVIIDGNSGNTLTFPGDAVNGTPGITFDSVKRNRIFVQYSNGEFVYNILISSYPDLTAPSLLSAVTNSNGTLITASFSEALGTHTLTFLKNGSAYAGTASIVGSTLQFTPTVTALSSDVISISGTVSDTATTPNVRTIPSTTVTNNVSSFVNLKSLGLTAANQIPVGTGNSALRFSNGTANSPFSLSFDFKYTSNGGYQRIGYIGFFELRLNASTLEAIQYGAGGTTCIQTIAFPTATWKRVNITYGLTNRLRIYIDGVLQTLGVTGSTSIVMSDFTTSPMVTVGGGISADAALTSGKIDNYLIINKELSSAEVNENTGGSKDPDTLSFAANIVMNLKFEDSLVDTKGNVTLTSSAVPTYSTDVK